MRILKLIISLSAVWKLRAEVKTQNSPLEVFFINIHMYILSIHWP